ncbi:MAG: YibE/F family protein [Hespellia sp.]|nr:YibE/F family protein [Hespellia sp.]
MILILAIIFLILILVVGGDRGVISLLALCGNILVLLISVLAMTGGMPPILTTLAGGVLVNCITLLYQNGKNKKTFAAVLSVGIVILILVAAVFVIAGRMHISGLNEIELRSDFSSYYSFNISVSMNQVCISMIILGLLGAVMDTAVAISSAIYEVHDNNPHLTRAELYHSGIAMGKDVLATTLNTLYFAYIGEALMLLLYLQKYNYSVVGMLNSESFLQEFTCIMFSAIGCLIIIPLSAEISAWIFKEKD